MAIMLQCLESRKSVKGSNDRRAQECEAEWVSVLTH